MSLNPLPKFVKTSYAKYLGLSLANEGPGYDSNTLYFITDGAPHQIYLGDKPYATGIVVLASDADFPAVAEAVENTIYYKTADSTAKIFMNGAFYALSVPKATSLSGNLSADDGKLPTAYAVEQFVSSQISSSADTKLDKISATNGHFLTADSNGSAVADSGLVAGSATIAASPNSTTLATEAAVKSYADGAASSAAAPKLDKFSGSNNNLVKIASNGSAVEDAGVSVGGSALNIASEDASATVLATEKAVKDYADSIGAAANSYTDSEIAKLGVVFNYKGVKADMAALQAVVSPNIGDVYNVLDTGDGTSGEYSWVGADTDNNVEAHWEALGTTHDMTGYVPKVENATAGHIATLTASGYVQDSSKSIGGSSITITNGSASANVIATEAAVKSYADQVASSAAGAYIPFVDGATNSNIAIFTSTGSKLKDSGVAIGGATLSGTPDSSTLATEVAVAGAIGAASSALNDAKINKFNGTANHLVTVDSTATNAQVKDSGLVVGSATIAATPNTTTIATEAAVKDYADSVGNTKLAKITASNDHVMFFTSNGSAVADKGITIDGATFSNVAAPSSTALATEQAVADYVASAMGWVTL